MDLDAVDTDICKNINTDIIDGMRNAFGRNNTPPDASFYLSDECLDRCCSDQYLNGEIIDAFLLTVAGLNRSSVVILPNDFLTNFRLDT